MTSRPRSALCLSLADFLNSATSGAMTTQTPALLIDDASRHYAGTPAPAVDGVTIDVAAGEFLALLGPSGCGKSTLLRMVAGFERLDGGRITVGGRTLSGPGTHVPPEERRIGLVFQSYALWPHMTVAGNVAYPLETARVPRAEREQRVRAALDTVGLSGFDARHPAELSGGQRQRVALARCLVMSPELVLLDEPLAKPRRASARSDGGGVRRLPRQDRRHHGLRHPRSGGGDGAGDAHRGARPRAAGPGGGAPHALPRTGDAHGRRLRRPGRGGGRRGDGSGRRRPRAGAPVRSGGAGPLPPRPAGRAGAGLPAARGSGAGGGRSHRRDRGARRLQGRLRSGGGRTAGRTGGAPAAAGVRRRAGRAGRSAAPRRARRLGGAGGGVREFGNRTPTQPSPAPAGEGFISSPCKAGGGWEGGSSQPTHPRQVMIPAGNRRPSQSTASRIVTTTVIVTTLNAADSVGLPPSLNT
ncbi:exported protein of unknown function (plasmid) [Azospirillum baldaniorum]|uniref:ABC transporter domain-containing protein n=1 Tax=Azospirillum baldaniorum TaxID=1064539 RepID=A0A9P1JUK4_9PROT|nr:exported protein of unknown function [Azospirillum baldaniorum]